MPTKSQIRQERLPADIALKYESCTIADVICTRCRSEIGRLQTIPVEARADMGEVYAELLLIAEEHEPACTNLPTSRR
jgi:hypothetical protein